MKKVLLLCLAVLLLLSGCTKTPKAAKELFLAARAKQEEAQNYQTFSQTTYAYETQNGRIYGRGLTETTFWIAPKKERIIWLTINEGDINHAQKPGGGWFDEKTGVEGANIPIPGIRYVFYAESKTQMEQYERVIIEKDGKEAYAWNHSTVTWPEGTSIGIDALPQPDYDRAAFAFAGTETIAGRTFDVVKVSFDASYAYTRMVGEDVSSLEASENPNARAFLDFVQSAGDSAAYYWIDRETGRFYKHWQKTEDAQRAIAILAGSSVVQSGNESTTYYSRYNECDDFAPPQNDVIEAGTFEMGTPSNVSP